MLGAEPGVANGSAYSYEIMLSSSALYVALSSVLVTSTNATSALLYPDAAPLDPIKRSTGLNVDWLPMSATATLRARNTNGALSHVYATDAIDAPALSFNA